MIAERSIQTYVEGRAVNLPGSDSQKEGKRIEPSQLAAGDRLNHRNRYSSLQNIGSRCIADAYAIDDFPVRY